MTVLPFFFSISLACVFRGFHPLLPYFSSFMHLVLILCFMDSLQGKQVHFESVVSNESCTRVCARVYGRCIWSTRSYGMFKT